jgi:hypothetical protein
MIKAFRLDGHVVLEVATSSDFDDALKLSTQSHSIVLETLPVRNGFSRYWLPKPSEGRFGAFLGVVFRSWPRRRGERRVLAEIRKLNGNRFCCKSDGRQINFNAPSDPVAKVRCGLHAGTYDWPPPSCLRDNSTD